jgi:hypothetical protein
VKNWSLLPSLSESWFVFDIFGIWRKDEEHIRYNTSFLKVCISNLLLKGALRLCGEDARLLWEKTEEGFIYIARGFFYVCILDHINYIICSFTSTYLPIIHITKIYNWETKFGICPIKLIFYDWNCSLLILQYIANFALYSCCGMEGKPLQIEEIEP